MSVAKVQVEGTTIIDLTQDTVTSSNLLQGETAHGANGEQIIGNMSEGGVDYISLLFTGDTPVDYENNEITTLWGYYTFTGSNLKSISLPNLEEFYVTITNASVGYIFYKNIYLKKAYLPKLRNATPTSSGWYNCPGSMFSTCTALEYADQNTIGGRNTAFGSSVFSGCTNLKKGDFNLIKNFARGVFSGCTSLNLLILRGNVVPTLGNLDVFTNTPFASDGSGGTLYVPQSLISSYESATNWSTLLSYTNNQILSIEGSQYENYYANGEPITP